MRKTLPLIVVLAASTLLVAAPAKACLWDSDTIAEERSKFPSAMEILAGKYNRHSPAFYEWRIKDRQKKLAADPDNLALLDDLGVALCKTGKFKEAVAIGERALALDAKRYESLSNLGTYHIFAGDLEKSAELIKAALVIEPDAHFGREKYQLYLVEYMMEVKRVKGQVRLPLRMAWPAYGSDAYKALTIAEQVKLNEIGRAGYFHFVGSEEDPAKAVHGILGMMRFANDTLPVLNEAVGDLWNFTIMSNGDKQLAARAYLKASYHTTSETAQNYRELAQDALRMVDSTNFEHLEKDFKEELAQGQAWLAQIASDEANWIATNTDPEAAFNLKYRAEPELAVNDSPFEGFNKRAKREQASAQEKTFWVLISGLVLTPTAIALYLRSLIKRRKAAKTALAANTG